MAGEGLLLRSFDSTNIIKLAEASGVNVQDSDADKITLLFRESEVSRAGGGLAQVAWFFFFF